MIKKWFLRMGLLVFAVSLTNPVIALAPRRIFMNGWALGLNGGSEINTLEKRYNLLNYSAGFMGGHADYNRFVSDRMFFGAGLEATASFKGKNVETTNDVILTLKRKWSGALTLRVGALYFDTLALEVNGAVLLSGWHDSASTAAGYSRRRVRSGYAPGVGATLKIGDRYSIGLNYRYEIYPHSTPIDLGPPGSPILLNPPIISITRVNTQRIMLKVSIFF